MNKSENIDKVTKNVYTVVATTIVMATAGVCLHGPIVVGTQDGFDVRGVLVATSMLVLYGLLRNYLSRWEIARPDQWQLLIRDGELVSASVGGSAFRGIFDRIVRFPSAITKVNFRVEQVSK